MVAAILETHNIRLINYLTKAHKRLDYKAKAYDKLDKQIKKVKDIGILKKEKPAAQKRKLAQELNDLKKAMIKVIEAEKMMKFMHRTKTAEEIAMEEMVLELEGKLNIYLGFREERLKRFEELEKKVAKSVEEPKLLPSPKPVPEEKLPVKISEKKVDKETVAAIRKEVNALKNKLNKLKKNKKHPKAKLAALDKKIKDYNKRLKSLAK